MVAFMQALPLVIALMDPIYYFGSNHDWDHLRIDHGWYKQQQHILIVIFDIQDLEVDFHEPEVWDGVTPCPL